MTLEYKNGSLKNDLKDIQKKSKTEMKKRFPTLITFAEINQHCFQETIIFLHVLVE